VNISWEFITECLRNELQEYGALLALFEEQQANLLRRDADQVAALALSIEEQARATHTSRERREQCVNAFAEKCGCPTDSSLRQMLPHFPAEVQPLLNALIDEINHLIHRIRRDARQNQMLLSRTVEAHEEALRALMPDAFKTRTYSPYGAVSAASVISGWQAAG
jgi:flagellar biosynthesis/type III secretory pathway chaperone